MTPENVTCPVCDGPMTSRVNGRTLQRFWGCVDYPRCNGTRNTDGEAPHERTTDRDYRASRYRDDGR